MCVRERETERGRESGKYQWDLFSSCVYYQKRNSQTADVCSRVLIMYMQLHSLLLSVRARHAETINSAVYANGRNSPEQPTREEVTPPHTLIRYLTILTSTHAHALTPTPFLSPLRRTSRRGVRICNSPTCRPKSRTEPPLVIHVSISSAILFARPRAA